jgi:hypothetical protein
MSCQRLFRVLTPEGTLSDDTFVLPPEQPRNLKRGCTLVIHQRSGTLLAVRDTRLFPAEAVASFPELDAPKTVRLNYDRAKRVIELRLSCPDLEGGAHRTVETNETPVAPAVPILSPLMDYRKNLVG